MRWTWLLVLGGCVLDLEKLAGDDTAELPEECEPGDVQCYGDDEIRSCTDEGTWGDPETFICVTGECKMFDDQPTCL